MLLDTSGLLCFLDGRESRHGDAVTFFSAAAVRLAHSYVLAELVPLADTRGVPRRIVFDFAKDLLINPRVEVVWVDHSHHRAALDLLEARPDKTYSLCDAVSFILMRERGITEALTTDHHFEQEGFRALLRP